MNDLTFENTDKVFPAIQYQNGWVWVDKDADISVGLWVHGVGEVYKSKGYFRQVKNSGVYKVIAQTPDLDLEGLTVVEVDVLTDDERTAIWDRAVKRFQFKNDAIPPFFAGVYAGFEAAQSKGCYTEDDMLRLAMHCWNVASRPKQGKAYYINDIVKDYLQSIRPKIVVETEEELNEKNGSAYIVPSPITYQKNGRTYFKLKQ